MIRYKKSFSQSICIIMMFLLVVTGMCSIERTHSYLAYHEMTTQKSSSYLLSDTLDQLVLAMTEGLSETFRLQQPERLFRVTRRLDEKAGVRLLFAYAFSNLSILNSFYFLQRVEAISVSFIKNLMEIIGYMHSQDGQKPQFTF